MSHRRKRLGHPMRIGFFGLLGSGNLGNDASFEAVLAYIRREHPEATVDAMCMGPDRLEQDYGIEAIPLLWFRRYEGRVSGAPAAALKVLGKGIDAIRTARWVRGHDAVIIPGMGIMEASLPLRATGMPYATFVLCATARLWRTKVALVSVGATPIAQRAIQTLYNWAARLASYRSYRDTASREAMRGRGIDVSRDAVFPDLVFSLDVPAAVVGDPGLVGVGLMAYYGDNDQRHRSEQIYARYIGAMTHFVGWLLDAGYRVRLFWGDDVDREAVQEVLTEIGVARPGLGPEDLVAARFSSLRELMREMASVGAVVGTRYHNVLSALKLGKPTISVGYSQKHLSLMTDMGVPELSLLADDVNGQQIVESFLDLQRRSPEIRDSLAAVNLERKRSANSQFPILSAALFPLDSRAQSDPDSEAPSQKSLSGSGPVRP